MAQFEAVFSDGAIVTFEADSMSVADGLVILERDGNSVVVLNAMELLFIRDIDVDVEVADLEEDWDDEDDDEEWDDDDDSDDTGPAQVLSLDRERD